MTHLEAQVKSRATLFSLPCDASAGFGSVAVSTASVGEKLVVTGDLVNTSGKVGTKCLLTVRIFM